MSINSTKSAIGRGAGGAAFVSDLQKHLADYRKGRGYLSSSTAAEIKRQHLSNADLVPKDLAVYSQYSTFLGYRSKAYYVNSVYEVRETVEQIQNAPERAEKATADLKKSLGYA